MSRATSSELAYRMLRDKILGLELEPGAVLNETTLMDDLNLGRSPIRDALRRLQQENLVVILPRQGTIVSAISLAEFHEIFELRMELEGFAAFLAAHRAQRAHLVAFQQLLEEAKQAVGADDNHGNIEIDARFHRLVAEAAGNQYLAKQLRELFQHSVRLANLSRARSASVDEEIPDYEAFYQAIAARDGEQSRLLIRAHIQASQERIRAAFAPLANKVD